jgi:hypothetical protein
MILIEQFSSILTIESAAAIGSRNVRKTDEHDSGTP